MKTLVTPEEIKIRHQQSVADYVIALLRQFDPLACVAGGAPRDWYLGIPAQDLDFYISLPSEYADDLAAKLRLLTGLDFQILVKELELEQKYENCPYVHSVWESNWQGCKIQLIVTYQQYSPEDIHELFPFDICQVKYTSGKGIQGTENFYNAVKNRRVKQVQPLYNAKYGEKIFKRFTDLGYTCQQDWHIEYKKL
jgi:hypothetical protein